MVLRNFFLAIGIGCVLSLLSSCINYQGMTSHAEPYTAKTLTTVYHPPSQAQNHSTPWWFAFHDETLNQLINKGLSQSPNLQMAENRIRKACYLAQVANADRFPTLDMNGTLTRERFSNSGLIPPPFNDKTFNIGTFGFNLNYEFDFWGQYKQQAAAASSQLYAAKADDIEAQLVVASTIAASYFQLQAELANLKAAKTLIKTRESIYQLNRRLAARGIRPEMLINNSLADIESARLSALQYQQAVELTKHQLAILTGQNPYLFNLTMPPLFDHPQIPVIPTNLPANLLGQRPDIIAARARTEAAAHEINVAKARFFPNINLAGLFSYQSIFINELFSAENQTNSIGGAFDLPIFDANKRRASLGASYANYDLAVNAYNQTILKALAEVANQQSTLATLKPELSAAKSSLSASIANYKLTRSRYNHGLIDEAQVFAMQELVLQQKIQLNTLQAEHLQAIVGLIKALGGQSFLYRGEA